MAAIRAGLPGVAEAIYVRHCNSKGCAKKRGRPPTKARILHLLECCHLKRLAPFMGQAKSTTLWHFMSAAWAPLTSTDSVKTPCQHGCMLSSPMTPLQHCLQIGCQASLQVSRMRLWSTGFARTLLQAIRRRHRQIPRHRHLQHHQHHELRLLVQLVWRVRD